MPNRFQVAVAAVLGVALPALSQSPPRQLPPSSHESIASLTPGERQEYSAAGGLFDSQNFPAAFAAYNRLLSHHPGDPLLTKMTAETALDLGERSRALALLQPVEQRDPNDWQAAALLARAYNESGDPARRDAEIARLSEFYRRGLTPRGLSQYILERTQAGDRTVQIFNSLAPWGSERIYNYARVFDSRGNLLMRIELKSPDADQALWARKHPREAAAGNRVFFLDGYLANVSARKGQPVEHALYGSLDGQLTFDQVRTAFLDIATGQLGRISADRLNLQPPVTQ